ncbi:MAG: hypothetical protein ACRDNJ_10180 [Solirubrobacteraceae bacterium]
MSCAREPLAPAPLPQEAGIYHAGPLTLAVGSDLAQHPEEWLGRYTSGSETIAVLTGSRPVVVSVDSASRSRFSLAFPGPGLKHPSPIISDGLTAMRLPACGGQIHRFAGGIMYTGTSCARLHVSQPGHAPVPLLIPVGNTLRGCRRPSPVQPLSTNAAPFLGVSCPEPNSIACGRVGIGVHLSRRATLVVVRVAGQLVTLSPPSPRPDDLWLGYLFDAGLRHGSLFVRIPPTARRWSGIPEIHAHVRVTAFFPNGRAAALNTTVPLHPGFG